MSHGKNCTANEILTRVGNLTEDNDNSTPQNMQSNPPSNLASNQMPRAESPEPQIVAGMNQLSVIQNLAETSGNSTSTSFLPNSHPVYNWQATKTTVSYSTHY